MRRKRLLLWGTAGLALILLAGWVLLASTAITRPAPGPAVVITPSAAPTAHPSSPGAHPIPHRTPSDAGDDDDAQDDDDD